MLRILSCGKPTLIEQIVNLIPGHYVVKCAVFSSLLGVPLLLLARFLDTFDVQTALAVFGPLLWQNIVTFCFANFVLVFYAVYGIKYMRSRIAALMPEIEFILPKTDGNGLQRIFKPIYRLAPVVVLSILLLAASLASFPDQVSQHSAGILSFAQIMISTPLLYLAYGTFIWVYSSSVLSLYTLGRQRLKLREFYEDSHLGVKPIGSLSFSLALVYFSGLALVFFSFISIPLPLESAVGAMMFGGIIVFFLPLYSFHEHMKKTKRLELERTKERLDPLLSSMQESLQDVQMVKAPDARRILAADIIDRQVNSIPVWPFETRTLTWLSAIVLMVVVSMIAKYVTVLFGS